MDIKDIYKSIRPLKNRIHLNNAILCVVSGLIAAGILSLILGCLSLFLPVPYVLRIIIVIYISVILLTVVISLFLRPGNLKTIKVADSLGLKERLVTAYELKDDPAPLSKIQRYDALKAVSKVSFKSLYSIKVPKYHGLASIALVLLVAVTFIIPSGSKEKAQKIENLLSEVKKQAENIDKERKELSKKANVSEKTLQDMNKRIDELLKELKKADNEAKAIKALSKARHELEDLRNKGLSSDLKKLGEKLSENEAARSFGEALKNGDMAEMKKRLEQLNNKLQKLDAAGKKDLAQMFKKAAGEVSKNKELAQNLYSLSQAVASGNLSSIGSDMMSLQNTLSELAESDSELADAMQQYENEVLKQMADSLDNAKNQISNQSGNSSKVAQGSGQGKNGQNGNGQGKGSGSGDGKSRKGGGGAGNQSSNGDLGYSGDESGSGSRAPGQKQVKDYESVYVPSRLGGDAASSQVKGQKNKSGESQWAETDKVPIEKGSTVPYDQVLGNYKNDAMNSIQDSPVPPVMKDIVRDYFSSLE